MKQTILRQGDLVRYYIRNETLDGFGFVLDQFYIVETGHNESLYAIRLNGIYRHLFDESGQLNEYFDHFIKIS